MDLTTLERRLTGMSPATNAVFVLGLTALVCLQVWALARWQAGAGDPGGEAYLLAAGAFLPLLARHRLPAVALVLSGACALAYLVGSYPSAFVVAGPMIAMYSLAVHGRRFVDVFVALVAAALVVAAAVFTISDVGWMTEAGGTFALLAAAAFAGGIQRSRRAYTTAMEARALEAERTREEEALRRAEEERLRIAREVHDVVAHTLSVVIVQANAALQLLESHPERARASLQAIADSSRSALTELRSTLRVLRDGDAPAPREPARDLACLDELVAPALEAGLDVRLDVEPGLERIPAIVGASAYRIVQEAVTNVLRHSSATRLRVHVGVAGETLAIDVVDDGSGDRRARAGSAKNRGHERPATTQGAAARLTSAAPGANPAGAIAPGGTAAAATPTGATAPIAATPGPGPTIEGNGLRGMRERVAALGGCFSAEPRPDGGFEVSARLPLKAGG